MQPVKCPEDGCGAYNDPRDPECARCGRKLNSNHKQDDRKRFEETHRRRKRHFDDEELDDDSDRPRR